MKNPLQEYFYYTRLERNGLLALGSIALLCFFSSFIIEPFWSNPTIDFSQFQAKIDAFQPKFEEKQAKKTTYYSNQPHTKSSKTPVPLFNFDPNTADKTIFNQLGLSDNTANNIINYREKIHPFRQVEDLKKIYTLKEVDYLRLKDYVQIASLPKKALHFKQAKPFEKESATALTPFLFNPNTVTAAELAKMNLPKHIITTMLNFRNKGGTFRKPEDLAKVYGLSAAIFEQLQAYIELDAADAPPSFADSPPAEIPSTYVDTSPLSIDINQATVDEWQTLKGIGPHFAKKIVYFRDKLGGFSSIAQVGTTRQLPDSTFQQIKNSLELSPVFKQIAINTVDVETLTQHPYIKINLARAIVNYRQQHGNFKDIEAFKKMRILRAKDAEKLSPYLDFSIL